LIPIRMPKHPKGFAVLACTRSNRDLYPEASLRGAHSPVSI
jgi:hypothetical protein